MDVLNEYSLVHIFNFLDSIDDWLAVSKVCTRWRNVMSSHIWVKMKVFAVDTRMFPKIHEILTVQKLIQLLELAGPHIRYVNLELENVYITRVHLGQHLFTLEDYVEARDLIEILAENSGNMEELELVDCDQRWKNNRLLRSLFLINNNLQEIKFLGCNLQTIFDEDIVLPSVKKVELNLRFDFLGKPLRMTHLHASLPNVEEVEAVLELVLTTNNYCNVDRIYWLFRHIVSANWELKTLKLYFLNEYYGSQRFLKSVANSSGANSITSMIDAEIIDCIVSQIMCKCVHLERILFTKLRDKLVLSNANVRDLLCLPSLKEIATDDVVFIINYEIPKTDNPK